MRNRLAVLALVFTVSCDKILTDAINNAFPVDRNAVGVMSITTRYASDSIYILFDKAVVNDSDYYFGQHKVEPGSVTLPIILKKDSLANLIAKAVYPDWVFLDQGRESRLQFFTDFQGSEAARHPGIVYTPKSEILVATSVFQRNDTGTGSTLLVRQYNRQALSQPGFVTQKVPPTPGNISSSSYIAQRYQLGCNGNDTLTFRAQKGFISEVTDRDNPSGTVRVDRIPEIVIICEMFANASLAEAAIEKHRIIFNQR